MDVNFYKGNFAVLVEFTGEGAIAAVGRDEGRQGNCARIREEECDLLQEAVISTEFNGGDRAIAIHLSNPPDVLPSILLAETEILVQPEAHIVAIETIGGKTEVKQMLFKRNSDGRFTTGGEASKPEGETLLAAQDAALLVGEAVMPCDIPGPEEAQLAVEARDRGDKAHLRRHDWYTRALIETAKALWGLEYSRVGN